MIRGVSQIGVRVRQAGELAPIARWLAAAPEADGTRWRAANVHLAVAEGADESGAALKPHEQGITHFCLQARDPWPMVDDLAVGGMTFTAPLTTLGNGTHYAYGALPSGPIVEIESAVFVPEAISTAWVAHVAFATPDLRRLSAFYTALTGRAFTGGFNVPPRPENAIITGYDDPAMRVGWVPCGNIMLEFWQYAAPPTVPRGAPAADAPGYTALVFETTGLGQGTDALSAAGVADLSPVRREDDGALHAQGRDPDGNAIGFVCFDDVPHSPRALAALDDPWLMPRLSALRSTLPPPHFRPEMTW